MKRQLLATAALAAGLLVGCNDTPVRPVAVLGPENASAYQPQIAPKPLPPQYVPAPASGTTGPLPSIQNEEKFVEAYAKKSPRIMVFVNRTIQGDPLPKDGLDEVIRVEEHQTATGAVSVANNNSTVGSSQSAGGSIYGSNAGSSNYNNTQASSFSSGGPADYTHSTSVKKAADKYDMFGASADDYEMIEASIVQYFDNSGKVRIQDSDAARAKLTREQLLRIENGDPAANRLLATELQADVLIRVTAKPTTQASGGNAIRLIAKAVSTTDARNLGTAFVDMPLPMSKTNINTYTRWLSEQLMGQMATKWSQPAEYDPVEVRIYKVAAIDDALKIRQWLQATKGVSTVKTNSATGGSTTAYASFAVGYGGAPEDLYGDLKAAIGMSQGLKAVDLENNTIDLEVTGPMNLVTTTQHVESTVTTETTTTEERKIEPINPAPAPQQ